MKELFKRSLIRRTATWLTAILIALLVAMPLPARAAQNTPPAQAAPGVPPLPAMQVAALEGSTGATQTLHNAAQTPDGLSDGEWQQIVGQIQQQAYQPLATGQPNHYRALNPAQGWALDFSPLGLRVQPQTGDWTWGLKVRQVGYPGAMQRLTSARLHSDETTVRLHWTPWLVEEQHNRSDGVKQNFVLSQRPAGGQNGAPLRLDLAITGDLSGQLDGGTVRFVDAQGATALTYQELYVYDASGQTLPAWFALDGDRLRISVADAEAAYPLTIDPLAQQAYLKASNTEASDEFGVSVALSGDTVVVGAYGEDSNATSVNGDGSNNSASFAGAAYVFVRSGAPGAPAWSQQAYLKASNTGVVDQFGYSVAVAGDTVVVGAHGEDSSATGVNGDGSNNSASQSGAAYVFVRNGAPGAPAWSQQAYLKASNTGAGDQFGYSVAVAGDTLVVGAVGEDSNATGVNGNGSNNSAPQSGAAYVFVRNGAPGAPVWSQQAYLKASNTGGGDQFGLSVAVAGDTLVVGAYTEASNATGVTHFLRKKWVIGKRTYY